MCKTTSSSSRVIKNTTLPVLINNSRTPWPIKVEMYFFFLFIFETITFKYHGTYNGIIASKSAGLAGPPSVNLEGPHAIGPMTRLTYTKYQYFIAYSNTVP